jgi:anti-sigma B factor antagonist
MRIKERQFGNAVVLDLSGPIKGRGAASAIEEAAREHAAAGTRRIIANLADVPSVDLGGLGALVEAARTLREVGCAFSLASVTRRIHDLIVITRLLTAFDTFDTVEEAAGAVETVPALSPVALGAIGRFLRRA